MLNYVKQNIQIDGRKTILYKTYVPGNTFAYTITS